MAKSCTFKYPICYVLKKHNIYRLLFVWLRIIVEICDLLGPNFRFSKSDHQGSKVMCFMQKNNCHVKFPLSSECLNVRMVRCECLSVDLVSFIQEFHEHEERYLHGTHWRNCVLTTFTDFSLYGYV